MHQIKRAHIYWAKGNKERVSILAFIIMLKKASDMHSTIKNYSVNKIHAITGCSWQTCKKYMDLLMKWGYVSLNEKNNSITLKRLSSGTKHCNLCIDGLDFRMFQAAKESVMHLIRMVGIARKRFIKEVARAYNNPKNWPSKCMVDDRKKARILCKSFVHQDPHTGEYKYVELGMSYKTIAKEWGVSIKTAVRIVKDGVKRHYYAKQRHFSWSRLKAGEAEYGSNQYTFTWKGFGCIVGANSYTLSKEWRGKLNADFSDRVQRPMLEEEYNAYMERKEETQKRFRRKYVNGISELAEKYNVSEDYLYSQHTSLYNLESMLSYYAALHALPAKSSAMAIYRL